MRRSNGTGGIRTLPGHRRKRYQAVVSRGIISDGNTKKYKQVSLGCYATRKEAEEALAVCLVHQHMNLEDRHMTFSDIFEEIYSGFTASMQKSLRSVYHRAAPFIGNTRIIDIRKREIDMIALLFNGTSQSTQTNIKILMKRVFDYAMEYDIVSKDYSRFLRFPETALRQEKRSYSREEIRTLCRTRDPFQLILLYSGLRMGELIHMKSRDVYEEDGILCFHVTQAKTAAGIRTIPVHSQIMDFMHLQSEYLISPHVTYGTHLARYHHTNATLGIHGHTPHDLRRTFSTYAKHCGMDDFYRRALLGHTQNDLTNRVYTDALIPDLKKQIERIHYDTL